MLKPTLSSPFSVYITSFLTSQIISNVPAAVLLSQYTDRIYFPYLLQGVNVGAMGSIIGSLASLISLKYMLKDYKSLFKRYLMEYTLVSFVFIIIITLVLFI
jgi:Na+/H+ antiporter NhaD/arsenite permease-like protein